MNTIQNLSRFEMKKFMAGGSSDTCSNRGEACNSDRGLKCCEGKGLVCAEFKCQWETQPIEEID